MPATVTSITPRRAGGPARTPQPPRRPFRDNPRLILAGIAILVGVLIALLAIARGTSRLSPDFLSEFVLYALSAADLTMLVALFFVLARNIVKLVVERRKALPFARFRAKLVVLLLAMTFVPGGARPHRRQRADWHEHRPLVQRADGRDPVVGQQNRQ
jgi:hypothetical protein